MKKINQKGLAPLIILIIVAALAGASFLGYRYYSSKNIPTPSPVRQAPKSTSSTVKKVTIPPRSIAPGVILAALTAHGYNPKTGSAIKPDKYFSPKDKQIYLLMNVNKPKIGTRIEYVRYLQGKYLDHRSIKIAQSNWKYAYFGWTNKPGKDHKKGIYRVRVYSNGVLEKKINYLIRN